MPPVAMCQKAVPDVPQAFEMLEDPGTVAILVSNGMHLDLRAELTQGLTAPGMLYAPQRLGQLPLPAPGQDMHRRPGAVHDADDAPGCLCIVTLAQWSRIAQSCRHCRFQRRRRWITR